MAQEDTRPDEDYELQLRQQRRDRDERSLETEEAEERKVRTPTPSGDHTVVFLLAFLVALFSDLADIFVIGSIPLIGDTLDAATGAILSVLFLSIGGRRKFSRLVPSISATAFELLPLFINDYLPTYVIEVIVTWFMVKKESEQANEQLEEAI